MLMCSHLILFLQNTTLLQQQTGFAFLTSLNIDVRPCNKLIPRVVAYSLGSGSTDDMKGMPGPIGPRGEKRNGKGTVFHLNM